MFTLRNCCAKSSKRHKNQSQEYAIRNFVFMLKFVDKNQF